MDIKYGDFSFATSGIPIPRITYSFQPTTTSAGRQIGTALEIKLKGQIYGTGDYAVIKASGLHQAFAQDYVPFKLLCKTNTSEGTVLFPKGQLKTDLDKSIYVKNINFTNSSDETMYYIVDFDIDLGASISEYQHYMGEGSALFLRSLSDAWSVEMVNEKADYLHDANEHFFPSGGPPGSTYYKVSRAAKAAGNATNDKTSFENAKEGIKNLLKETPGLFKTNSDVLGATPAGNILKIFDRTTSYEADLVDGSLGFTENYIAFTGNPSKKYTHDLNISNTIDKDFNRTVTVNGNIQGYTSEPVSNTKTTASADQLDNDDFLKTRQTTHSAYINASGGLDFELPHSFARALDSTKFPSGKYIEKYDSTQTYEDFQLEISNDSNKTNRQEYLNPIHTNFNSDHDINNGSISYSISYDNKPRSLIPGALVEQLSMTDNFPVTGYAAKNIMLRGAIPQHLGTISTPSRTVTYNATFPSIISTDGKEVNDQTVLTEDNYQVKELANAMNQFDPAYLDPSPNTESSAVVSWVTDDSFEINFVEGTLSKTLTWNYTIGK